jgi:GntR family transcriptional regulator
MRQLAADGLIQATIGRGSFVTPTPLGESPNTLMSFTELGAARGLVATATVLLAEVRPADLSEADAFAIAPGAEIFELERVRHLDAVPVAVDHARIPLNQAPSLPEHDFSVTSLYSVLDRHGVAPIRANYSVQATAADEEKARHLDMEVGEPLLVATTTAFDPSGQLIELTTMSYRGDRYRFQASLSRR